MSPPKSLPAISFLGLELIHQLNIEGGAARTQRAPRVQTLGSRHDGVTLRLSPTRR